MENLIVVCGPQASGRTPRSELFLELTDTEWPFSGVDHDRQIVRAIVTDGAGGLYFMRVERDDEFGRATLIETSGGGVEPGEDLRTAIRRELREELGAEVEILEKIGVVSDYYNLIGRHNINHYFLCRIVSFGETHMTEDEIHRFHLSRLKRTYPEALAEYERCACTRLGRLIANREIPVLMRAQALLAAAPTAFTRYEDLDARRLMDVYAESNLENAEDFFPDEKDKAAAVRKVEAGFLDFLRDEFFAKPDATYWVLARDGVWVSACRVSRIEDGLYYLEALETRPDSRRRGYAAELLSGVLTALKRRGPFRLCDCVGKRNEASLKTHAACGFRIVSEQGYDYLSGETNERTYGLEYRYPEPSGEDGKPVCGLMAQIENGTKRKTASAAKGGPDMPDRVNIISEFYRGGGEDERLIRTRRGQLEYYVTMYYIHRFAPVRANVLEIGAGTGRYSAALAKEGMHVSAVELVDSNFAVLKERAKSLKNLYAYQGDALDLSRFPDGYFDLTLALGPMYHLYEPEDVQKAIDEAIRVTKPGGALLFAFLSVYGILYANYFQGNWAAGQAENFTDDYRVRHFKEQLFTGYDVTEFEQLFKGKPVEHITTAGTDGMLEAIEARPDFAISDADFAAFRKWYLQVAEKRELLGSTNHLLYICRKNR